MTKVYGFPEMHGRWEYLIVHSAATPPSMDVDADWIDRVHRQKGWRMNGYPIVIKRNGTVQWSGTGDRCRPIKENGAHVGGCGPKWNKVCIGVCLIGGVAEDGRTPEDNYTPEQMQSLYAVVAELQEVTGIPDHNVIGHRDLIKMTNAAPKACPCMSVQQKLFTGFPEEDYEGRKAFSFDKTKRPPNARGDKLAVPKTYTCRPGDTVEKLSWAYGVKMSVLRELNDIKEDVLEAGKKLRFWD